MAALRTYPPPLDDSHIIRHSLIRIDIKFPFFNPGAGLVSNLLTVIIVRFGVGVVNVVLAMCYGLPSQMVQWALWARLSGMS